MKHIQKIRVAVQVLFLILTITALMMELSFIKILILLSTVVGGVYYCGWACSFGFIQDLGSKLGRRLDIKNRKLPANIHKVAVYMRYLLGVMVIFVASDAMMLMMGYEPRGGFLGLISGRIPSIGILIVIGFFILLSIKYDRVYCRYLCPEGARYGVMSLVRLFTVKRDSDKCVNCGKCDRACPMQIKVSRVEKMRSPQCVNCFECISACPIEGALTYGISFKKN